MTATTPSDQPFTPAEVLDLDAIEANAKAYPPGALLTAKRCIPDGQIQHGCVISSGERVKDALRAAFQATHKDVPRLVAEVTRLRDELSDLSELAIRLANAVEFVAGLDRPLTAGAPSGTNEREALRGIAAVARRAGLLPDKGECNCEFYEPCYGACCGPPRPEPHRRLLPDGLRPHPVQRRGVHHLPVHQLPATGGRPAERNPYGRCHACEALLVNADQDDGCPHCGVCGAVFVDGGGRGGRLCGRPAGHEGGHALAEPAPEPDSGDGWSHATVGVIAEHLRQTLQEPMAAEVHALLADRDRVGREASRERGRAEFAEAGRNALAREFAEVSEARNAARAELAETESTRRWLSEAYQKQLIEARQAQEAVRIERGRTASAERLLAEVTADRNRLRQKAGLWETRAQARGAEGRDLRAEVERLRGELDSVADVAYRGAPTQETLATIHERAKRAANAYRGERTIPGQPEPATSQEANGG